MALSKIRVLVVDASPQDRGILTGILRHAPDFEVIGQAEGVDDARNKIRSLNPCVITLDVSMEGRGGVRLLNNLMRLRPTPVVMCAAIPRETAEALQTLHSGAIQFVEKLKPDRLEDPGFGKCLVHAVRVAAYAPAPAAR